MSEVIRLLQFDKILKVSYFNENKTPHITLVVLRKGAIGGSPSLPSFMYIMLAPKAR